MLSVNNITMRFGPRVLFEDVTTTFMAGRRYAITGPNGAGKSTFMKILTGELEPTKGSITRPKKMGVLRQDQFAFDDFRVIDTVIMGNASLWKALVERDALYAKPHDHLTDADGMRLGELEGIVGEEGGYTAEADAAILLDGLGLEVALHERKMSELQGGQKVRVLLAQAMFGYALLQCLIVARLAPWLRQQPFSTAAWAYTFGIAALPLAALRFVERGQTGPIADLALPLFVAANLIIGWIGLRTLRLVIAGRLFPAAPPQ